MCVGKADQSYFLYYRDHLKDNLKLNALKRWKNNYAKNAGDHRVFGDQEPKTKALKRCQHIWRNLEPYFAQWSK